MSSGRRSAFSVASDPLRPVDADEKNLKSRERKLREDSRNGQLAPLAHSATALEEPCCVQCSRWRSRPLHSLRRERIPTGVRSLSCDGKVPGTTLDLTHWTNNETPEALYADTSTEIALNLARARCAANTRTSTTRSS